MTYRAATPHLLREIHSAARKLGAKRDLLHVIKSYGSSLDDIEVLRRLRAWNEHYYPRISREEPTHIEAAIRLQLYAMLENLGAPNELLYAMAGWCENPSRDRNLLVGALKSFNGRASDVPAPA
jgi:hypothetical protein